MTARFHKNPDYVSSCVYLRKDLKPRLKHLLIDMQRVDPGISWSGLANDFVEGLLENHGY